MKQMQKHTLQVPVQRGHLTGHVTTETENLWTMEV